MPHAESPTTQSMPDMVNGNKNNSQFINHLSSYPIVHDGIEKVKTNAYGQKTMEVADATYARFVKPVEPYLQTPYSYAKPYAEKLDSMADRSLSTVDAHFPIVKENTGTVVDKAVNLAMWPLSTTARTYSYVMDTWSDEYQKTANKNDRGPGMITSAMAIVSTELKIASDCLQVAADVLARRDHNDNPLITNARNIANNMSQKANQAADQANQVNFDKAQQQARNVKDNMQQQAQNGMANVQNKARDGANNVQNQAQDGMNRAQNKAQDGMNKAQDGMNKAQNKAQEGMDKASREANKRA